MGLSIDLPHSMTTGTFAQKSDAELRQIIVEGQSGWQQAYEFLFHERYIEVILRASQSRQIAFRTKVDFNEIIVELFELLAGKNASWKALRSWDQDKPINAWLFTIVSRMVVKMILARRISDNELDFDHVEDRRLYNDIDLQEVILTNLGEICAQLLILKYYNELSNDKIGDILDHDRKTVRTKTKKCLDELRRFL